MKNLQNMTSSINFWGGLKHSGVEMVATWQNGWFGCDSVKLIGRPDWNDPWRHFHQTSHKVVVVALPDIQSLSHYLIFYSPVAVKLIVWIVLASVGRVFFNVNSLSKFHNIPE